MLSVLHLLDLHRRVRLRGDGGAARGLPHLPRHRHGRRVGERRRARLRDVARSASRQGARLHAERVGDRLRGRPRSSTDSCRTSPASAGAPCSSSACCRRCSRSGFGAASRSRRCWRANASRAGAARPSARGTGLIGGRWPHDHRGAHADERVHDVRLVGLQHVGAVVPARRPAPAASASATRR